MSDRVDDAAAIIADTPRRALGGDWPFSPEASGRAADAAVAARGQAISAAERAAGWLSDRAGVNAGDANTARGFLGDISLIGGHANRRVKGWWVDNELADLPEDLMAISKAGPRARIAGHRAMGELAVGFANAEAPIGPRGEDRSEESLRYGPLSEATRYEADARYAYVIGPAYGKLVAEGANDAAPNPYIDRAVRKHRAELQEAFVDAFLEEAAKQGYDPRTQGVEKQARIRRVAAYGAVDVLTIAGAVGGAFFAGRWALAKLKQSQSRRVAYGAGFGVSGIPGGGAIGIVFSGAHSAFRAYKDSGLLRLTIRSARWTGRTLRTTNRALTRVRAGAMKGFYAARTRMTLSRGTAAGYPRGGPMSWRQRQINRFQTARAEAIATAVDYTRAAVPVLGAAGVVVAGRAYWTASKTARVMTRSARWNSQNRRIGARFRVFGRDVGGKLWLTGEKARQVNPWASGALPKFGGASGAWKLGRGDSSLSVFTRAKRLRTRHLVTSEGVQSVARTAKYRVTRATSGAVDVTRRIAAGEHRKLVPKTATVKNIGQSREKLATIRGLHAVLEKSRRSLRFVEQQALRRKTRMTELVDLGRYSRVWKARGYRTLGDAPPSMASRAKALVTGKHADGRPPRWTRPFSQRLTGDDSPLERPSFDDIRKLSREADLGIRARQDAFRRDKASFGREFAQKRLNEQLAGMFKD